MPSRGGGPVGRHVLAGRETAWRDGLFVRDKAWQRARMRLRAALLSTIVLSVAGCRSGATAIAPEPHRDEVVVSLMGARLEPPPMTNEVRAKRERELADARDAFRRAPDSADALIWFGRRTAYLGRYNEAIALFGEGIVKHPEDARFYRHRGHRYITVRRFDDAIGDLTMAASLVRGAPDSVEPDGQPNAANVPTTTLHGNIAYHLGLAHYLKANWASALQAYEWCASTSNHPDHVVSSTYWRYLTLRRLGRHAEAAALLDPITPDMNLLENHAYHRMLLAFKRGPSLRAPSAGGDRLGGASPADPSRGDVRAARPRAGAARDGFLEDATVGYGLGIWHLLEGHREEGERLLRRTMTGPMWAAFGAIAAEAEIARLEGRRI